MSKSIASQVAKLQQMTVYAFRDEWKRIFGKEAQQRHLVYLGERLARKTHNGQPSHFKTGA